MTTKTEATTESQITMEELDRGDLVFFGNRHTLLSRFIQFGDGSKVSHVGIVLKNPPWILEKGLYLLESGYENFPDVVTHEENFGVRISKLSDVVKAYQKAGGEVWVRRSVFEIGEDDDVLKKAYLAVQNRPYDATPRTWFDAFFGLWGPPTAKRFTCSGLAAFFLIQLGVFTDVDWTYVTPTDLFLKDRLHWRRPYTDPCLLAPCT